MLFVFCSISLAATYSQVTVRADKEDLFNELFELSGLSDVAIATGSQTRFDEFLASNYSSSDYYTCFQVSNNVARTERTLTVSFCPNTGTVNSNNTVGNNSYKPCTQYVFYKGATKMNYTVSGTTYTNANTVDASSATNKLVLIQDANGWRQYSSGVFADFNAALISSVKFNLSYTSQNFPVYYSGELLTGFYRESLSRSVYSWTLGRFTGFNDSSARLDARLCIMYDPDVYYTIASCQRYYGQRLNNNMNIGSDGVLSVSNSSVAYYQGYVLIVQSDGYDLGIYRLYFTPYGVSVSSGDLINPDIDQSDFSSWWEEFNSGITQDNVNIGVLSNDFLPSGEFLSGDWLQSLGYIDAAPSGDFENVILNFITNVRNTLLGIGEQTITINIHGWQKTVSSNEFIVPNNWFKSLVTGFLVFGSVYLVYRQLHSFYVHIRTLDINGIENDTDVDQSFFM